MTKDRKRANKELDQLDRELWDILLNTPFVFWTCKHCTNQRVTWNQDHTVATCDNCGRKSTNPKPDTV
jgi:ribosomal protein S27E